jgi:uncharacterized protein YbbC (DUF1343 family)
MKHCQLVVLMFFFASASLVAQEINILKNVDVKVGAQNTEKYLPILQGKRVAIIANPSSLINKTHLVDTLLSLKVNVKKIFSPEHGFRGKGDAGEKLSGFIDKKTGLPVISLYGKNMKPSISDLQDVDLIIYDLQDVGVRFYTYISTLTYGMEAAAENNKEFIVLDRPNPNGFYVDGPVLEPTYKSFLGLHPVPIVYGMTCGEYAMMVNEEGWLNNKVKCKLKVIPVIGYTHKDSYEPPVKPSPNLPNITSIFLYPSMGLFEGTIISVGRGTDVPFQVIGHPELKKGLYVFTPKPNVGAKEPKYNGIKCYGYDLRNFAMEFVVPSKRIYLLWLTGCYNQLKRNDFFDENFNFHVGNSDLQKQIKEGKSIEEIQNSWKPSLMRFKVIRKKYLLYKDFE